MTSEMSCPHCGEAFDVTGEMERHIKEELQGELTRKIRDEFEEEFGQRLVNEKEEGDARRKVLEKKVSKQRAELNGLRESKVELDDLKAEQEIRIKEARADIKEELQGELTRKIRDEFEEEFGQRLVNEKEEGDARRKVLEKKVSKQRAELNGLRESKVELDDLKAEQEIRIKEARAEAKRQAKIDFSQDLEEKISERVKQDKSELELKNKKLEIQLERQNSKIRDLEEQRTAGHSELEGEALEQSAEKTLRDLFPLDSIKAVPKGAFGSDIEHMVMSTTSEYSNGEIKQPWSGKILWECKKHKKWNDDWIPKIRGNASAVSADVSVIVSTAMPKGVEAFTRIEDVWVCRYHELRLVATLLRHAIEVANYEKKRDQNMMTVQERVVEYISGPKFARVMRSVIDAFSRIEGNIRLEENYMKTNRKKNRLLLQEVIDAVTSMAAEIHHLGGGEFNVIRELDFEDPDGNNLLSAGDIELHEEE